MFIEYVKIYFIFFKIGLFAIGGGLVALPLLQEAALSRGWLTNTEFVDIIAVSQSTPGPIGVNMATYVGYTQIGVLGGIIATLGLVSPSFIIVLFIARFLKQFRENQTVQGFFYGIRPAVVGLILAAAYKIATVTLVNLDNVGSASLGEIINLKAFGLFFLFMYLTNKYTHHPIFYIVIAGIIGVVIF